MQKSGFMKAAALFMSTAFLISAIASPVFADGTPIIDTTKTGSVTINKLLDQNGSAYVGTGKDGQTLPADVTALKGCTFSYYKIGDVAQISSSAVSRASDSAGTNSPETTGLYLQHLDNDFSTLAAKLGISIPKTTVDGKTCYLSSDVQTAVSAMTADEGDTDGRGETQVSKLVAANRIGSLVTGDDGKASVSGLSLGVYLFAETAYPDSVVVPDSPFLVELPFTNIEGNGWEYAQYVYPKNQTLSVTKKIEAGGKELDSDDYQIGETVAFRSASDVPNLMGKKTNRKYVLTDKMTEGLTYKKDAVVKLGVTYTDAKVLTAGTDYTISTEGINGFVITLTEAGLNKLDNIDKANILYTDYSADLNEKATVLTANVNDMKVTYATSNTEDKAFDSSVSVYTYGMDLTKMFTDTSITDYSSVVFNIKDNDQTLSAIKTGDGTYTVTKADKAGSVSDLAVGSTGHLIVKGLDSRTYTLTEVKTAQKESLLMKDLTLKITSQDPVNGTIKEASVNSNSLTDTENMGKGIAAFTVANNPIITFLRTGGSGLILMIVIGGLLLIAGIFTARKFRKV